MNLMDAMIQQTPRTPNVMLCHSCRNWIFGTVGCRAGYFIAYSEAYIPKCEGYEQQTEGEGMTTEQRAILADVELECDEQDRSTEYMIQMMIDRSGCSHDEVIEYLKKKWAEKGAEK